jgi:glycine oxidase
VNIAIVGAGVVGCAIAYELASRGATVRVVDERGIGRGATQASAGMLAPYTEGHIDALRTLGVHSLALYDRFVARAAADAGCPIEYDRSGSLHVAVGADEERALRDSAAELVAEGVAHTLLDADGTRALEPSVSDVISAALHIHPHGFVAPGPLTRALAAAARRHGTSFDVTRVVAIEEGAAPRLRTSEGAIDADAVIIAAGSWSALLTAEGRPPVDGGPHAAAPAATSGESTAAVRPIRGQLLQMRLPSRPAARVIWGSACYLVPWSDGTVLAGATVEDVGFDERATIAGMQHLLASSVALLPPLAHAAFDEVRVGLRPMTRDELPAVGPSSTMRGVFYATGHYRNGVLLAPLTATLIADLLLAGREHADLALVRPQRLGL